MSKQIVLFLLTITFFFGFLSGNLFPRKLYQPPLTATNVVDGDTVDLSDGRRLRLRAINAPELTKNDCLGQLAKARLRQLLLNQKVTLKETNPTKDNFGRTLATPFIKGFNPTKVLVKEGLARVTGPFLSDDEKQNLFQLEEEAKNQQRGLYDPKICPPLMPKPPSCNIKGNVHWKKRQKLYFPPDCPGYARIVVEPKNGDAWFCSVDEAVQAGFALSSTCPRGK